MSDTSEIADNWRDRPWYVFGRGRVGESLVRIAHNMGLRVAATWNRTRAAAESVQEDLGAEEVRHGKLTTSIRPVEDDAVVWLTVSDGALEDVAETVISQLPDTALVVHTCGSRGVDLLKGAGASEAAVAHPLWAISNPAKAADDLTAATWSVEGTPRATMWVETWLEAYGANVIELSGEDRALYHAAAVMAANLMVGALEAAVELAVMIGIERADAHAALWPLAHSALQNVRNELEPSGLTGPVARGDEETIERHEEAIADTDDAPLLGVYRSLTQMCRRLVERDTESSGG